MAARTDIDAIISSARNYDTPPNHIAFQQLKMTGLLVYALREIRDAIERKP